MYKKYARNKVQLKYLPCLYVKALRARLVGFSPKLPLHSVVQDWQKNPQISNVFE
jgi:hypothetical protein